MRKREYREIILRTKSAFDKAEYNGDFGLPAAKKAFCRWMSKFMTYSKAMYLYFNKYDTSSINGFYSISMKWCDRISKKELRKVLKIV